jgi:hypothetical protein
MTFFTLAGGALGIPGDARDAQFCSFGDRSLGDKVKVSLNPFIVEVADFADLQVDLYDLGSLISNGIIERNIQDGLRYGKLMHEIFCTKCSFPELLPERIAEKLLNQGRGPKSIKKGKGSTSPKDQFESWHE